MLSLKKEPSNQCRRIIILKPKGFTANSIDELSSHPEAQEATVEIKGAARAANIDYSLIEMAGKKQKDALYDFADAAKEMRDSMFEKEPDTVESIYSMDPLVSLPALITLLNIEEKGKHEQCTVYALILKIAKKRPELALRLLKKAEKDKVAPLYYLEELIKKVNMALSCHTGFDY